MEKLGIGTAVLFSPRRSAVAREQNETLIAHNIDMVFIRKLNRVKVKITLPPRARATCRAQYLYKTAAAVGASQYGSSVANNADSVFFDIDVIETRIDALIHILKGLTIVVRPRNKAVAADYPDFIAVIIDGVNSRVGTPGLDYL